MKITRLLLAVMVLGISACSGGGGDSTSLSPSGSATLSDGKSSLQVPTGSFGEPINVTLEEGIADVAHIGNVQALSKPATLTFSKASTVSGDDPISLDIKMDPEQYRRAVADGKGVYAKIRIEGARLSSEVDKSTSHWLPIIGEIDPDTATLKIALYAGAEKIHVMAVAGNELKIVAPDSNGKSKKSSKALSHEQLGTRPWAIICNLDLLPDHGVTSCDPSNSESAVAKIRNDLVKVSRDLKNLGFNQHVVYQLTALGLVQSNLPSFPARSALQQIDPAQVMNVAYLTDANIPCQVEAEACFDVATGILHFSPAALDPAGMQRSGNPIAHELAHSIQAHECPSVFQGTEDEQARLNPFVEGTASAIEQWSYVNGNREALAGRPWRVPRHWAFSFLRYEDQTPPYQTAEFYTLADDGDLRYFPALFSAFEGDQNPVFSRRLDAAVKSALGKELRELFLKAMAKLHMTSANSVNYRQYEWNWDIFQGKVKTLAAHHFLFLADFRNNPNLVRDRCYNEASIIQGVNPNLALVVISDRVDPRGTPIDLGNGYIANYTTEGKELGTDGCTLEVIVVNTSPTGGVADSMDYTLEVGFD